MTNPYDPNQGTWQGGQGQGPSAAGQQPGQPPVGWQPYSGGQPPVQGYPAGQGQGQFGWQPSGPPPGPGGWSPMGPGGQPPQRRTTLWVTIGVVVVLVAAGIVTWLVLANKDDNNAADDGSTDTAGTSVSGTDPSTSGSSGSPVAGVKVKVGDCVAISNASKVDLNEAVVACTDQSAVYKVTVIGTSKSACDKNEANWVGATGVLTGKTLCLLPNLNQGDCFRTGDAAANGDYEKIPCSEAKSGDSKVAYASTTTADVNKCAKGTSPYDFPKRKVLYCFADVS